MSRMAWRVAVVAAALCGALAGMVATLVVSSPPVPSPASAASAAPEPRGGARQPEAPSPTPPASDVVTTAGPAAVGATTSTGLPQAGRVLLVWTADGLPSSLIMAAAGDPAVSVMTLVRGDHVGLVTVSDGAGRDVLDLEEGWQVPLDVLAVDPADHSGFVPDGDQAAVAGLRPGQALLSATSARLRGVVAGAGLVLAGGARLRVAAVVSDAAAAGAELLVHSADAETLDVATPRFLLVSYDGSRASLQDRLASATGPGAALRFRTAAETTWLRHGDAVLPQAIIKAAFGEFAVRDGPDRTVEVDPAWVAAHVVTAEVPVLGEVRCHRLLMPRLSGAMDELVRRNLAHLVDPASYVGCWVPRRIAPGQPLSRHAWGVAVDLNVGDNPRGSFSTQDPRLVEVMRAHGFTWGGTWLVPDPAHHEIVTTVPW